MKTRVVDLAIAQAYPETDGCGIIKHSPGQSGRLTGRRAFRTTRKRKGLGGDEVVIAEFRAWILKQNAIG